jgi:hypothetical protein
MKILAAYLARMERKRGLISRLMAGPEAHVDLLNQSVPHLASEIMRILELMFAMGFLSVEIW